MRAPLSRAAVVVAAGVLTVAACGADEPVRGSTNEAAPTTEAGGDDPTTTTTTEAADDDPVVASGSVVSLGDHSGDDVVTVDLGLDEREITFANLRYVVTGGVLTDQDLRSYRDGTDPEKSDEVHVILDVRVDNETGRQLDSDDAAISLVVDGDRRLPVASSFLWDATGFIRANSTVTSHLAFEVDELDLSSAVLTFGAQPDAPASLPLVGEVPDDGFPVEFELSGTATGVGPTNGGTVQFEVVAGDLFLDLPHGLTTSPTGERANADERFLRLLVRTEKLDGRGDDLLVDAFRLAVGPQRLVSFDVADDPAGSTGSPRATLGATTDVYVLFVVPADATEVTLEVGDAAETPGTIPLTLPAS